MNNKNLKNKLYEIIFEADTPSGKYFDLALIVMIVLSIIVVMLESVQALGTSTEGHSISPSGFLHCFLPSNILSGFTVSPVL